MSSPEKAAYEQRIDDVVRVCLRKRERLNLPVMSGKTSPEYAPKPFAAMADGKAYTTKDYERAMERLLVRRMIHVGFEVKHNRGSRNSEERAAAERRRIERPT